MVQTGINTAKNYKWFIIGGLLLALGLFLWIYFSGKAAGKRAVAINNSNPIDDNGSGNTSATGAFASTDDVRQLAGQLHDDLSGINLFGHNNELYEKLLAMSDTDFIRVNNEFNDDYQKDSGQTFNQWINAESTAIQIGTKWTVLRDSINDRFSKLKII